MSTFKERLRARLKESEEAFEGIHKDSLDRLLGLSREDIDSITPDTTDLEVYDKLIILVKEASASNISQAELKGSIKDLGSTAIEIAAKIGILI